MKDHDPRVFSPALALGDVTDRSPEEARLLLASELAAGAAVLVIRTVKALDRLGIGIFH